MDGSAFKIDSVNHAIDLASSKTANLIPEKKKQNRNVIFCTSPDASVAKVGKTKQWHKKISRRHYVSAPTPLPL